MSQTTKKRKPGKIRASAPPPRATPREAAAPSPVRARNWQTWEPVLISALLVILVFAVFGQAVHFSFVDYDDDRYIYRNPVILHGITIAGLRYALFYGGIGHWHPLTWVSHMLDCNFYGTWAGGHHLTNVILHAAAAVLLFLVFLRMTGALWPCAFVAAVWAIHPLRAESVAWISERKDVLSAVFFAVTLGAYLRYVRQPSAGRYLLVLLSFTLGLLSKNMLVTLPCVLLLLDYWPLRRLNGRSQLLPLLKEKIPLVALSAISCAITFLVPEKVGPRDFVPLWLRVENSIVSCCTYIRQTVWPAGLATQYPNPVRGFPWWEVAGALALLCAISAVVFALRNRYRFGLVSWLWFIGMLMPVIGLVQISNYARADRYTYLPQIGLLLGATWAVREWAGERRQRRIVAGAAGVAIVIALAVAGFRQAGYWRDSMALWTRSLDVTQDNSVAHENLGGVLLEQGRTAEAIAQIRESLRINPAAPLTHYDLGLALLREKRGDDAIAEFRRALRADPTLTDARYSLASGLVQEGRIEDGIAQYREALRRDPGYARVHGPLGAALLQQGRTGEAIAELREALSTDPNDAEAHSVLGSALMDQGQGPEAIAELREALRLNPKDPAAHSSLGLALFAQGGAAEAIAELNKSLGIDGANPQVLNNLACILLTAPEPSLRDGARALQLASKANDATGGADPGILDTLAAAYARTGRFPEATETAKKALLAAQGQSNDTMAGDLTRKIKFYAAGQTPPEVH